MTSRSARASFSLWSKAVSRLSAVAGRWVWTLALVCGLGIPAKAATAGGRTNAARTLPVQGESSYDNLIKLMGDGKVIVPNPTFGPNSSFEDLAGGLKSKDVSKRVEAIRAVWSNPWPFAKSLVPLLIESLGTNSDSNVFRRTQRSRLSAEAAAALGLLGPQARAAIPALVQVLGDPDELARANAAEAIERIEPANPTALPALLRAMNDPSGRVRYAANEALVEAGPVNTNVVRAFIAAVRANAARFSPNGSYNGPAGDIVPTSQAFFYRLAPATLRRARAGGFGQKDECGCRTAGFHWLDQHRRNPRRVRSRFACSVAGRSGLGRVETMEPKANAAVPQLVPFMENKSARPIVADLLTAIGAPAANPAIPAFEHCINEEEFPDLYLCEDLLKIAPSSKVALDGFEKITAKPQTDPLAGPNADVPVALANAMVAHARLIQGNRAPQMHFLYSPG